MVHLAQPVRLRQNLGLAHVHVQPPEPPRPLGFRLERYPPLEFLQINGSLYHLSPTSPSSDRSPNGRAPSLHGHYPASCYYGPVRRPPAVSPLPAFGYRTYLAAQDFSHGREGLLQWPGDALLPCCRLHPAQASPPFGWFESEKYCLRLLNTGSALRFVNNEATFAFTHRCGPEARSPRFHGALSMGSEVSVSLHPAIQATRTPATTASGLSPYSHHLPYPGHARKPDPKSSPVGQIKIRYRGSRFAAAVAHSETHAPSAQTGQGLKDSAFHYSFQALPKSTTATEEGTPAGSSGMGASRRLMANSMPNSFPSRTDCVGPSWASRVISGAGLGAVSRINPPSNFCRSPRIKARATSKSLL